MSWQKPEKLCVALLTLLLLPVNGIGPAVGLAFDGANIWATVASSNTVVKYRASDAAPLGAFPVGTSPMGIAFDGQNMWIANQGSNTISRR